VESIRAEGVGVLSDRRQCRPIQTNRGVSVLDERHEIGSRHVGDVDERTASSEDFILPRNTGIGNDL
jgi:hypothetical protein